jgi:hypothetical protein
MSDIAVAVADSVSAASGQQAAWRRYIGTYLCGADSSKEGHPHCLPVRTAPLLLHTEDDSDDKLDIAIALQRLSSFGISPS